MVVFGFVPELRRPVPQKKVSEMLAAIPVEAIRPAMSQGNFAANKIRLTVDYLHKYLDLVNPSEETK